MDLGSQHKSEERHTSFERDQFPSTKKEVNPFPDFSNGLPTVTDMKNPEYVADLEARVIKLRTDNEIMSITMKHLQDELNNKSDLIRRQ
jgi:hypothetical protein